MNNLQSTICNQMINEVKTDKKKTNGNASSSMCETLFAILLATVSCLCIWKVGALLISLVNHVN